MTKTWLKHNQHVANISQTIKHSQLNRIKSNQMLCCVVCCGGLCWVVCSHWDVFPARRSKRHWRDACAESEHEWGGHADVKLPTWLGRTHNRETSPYESETAESQHEAAHHRKDNVKPYHRWITLFSISLSLKGKLGEKILSAQSFYMTLTKRSFNRQF